MGSIPLHTLDANVDYAVSVARTTYGVIGIKVWIYKGKFGEEVEPRIRQRRRPPRRGGPDGAGGGRGRIAPARRAEAKSKAAAAAEPETPAAAAVEPEPPAAAEPAAPTGETPDTTETKGGSAN